MGRSRQKRTKFQWRDRPRKIQQPPATVPPSGAEEISDGGPTRFFGCYLLTSLSPRYKGHSYIGFTVNPKRRIRQHNGEITSGASKTKRKRPWEMVFCIHGFPSQVAALQFEWAWQHPKESLAVKEAASSFKSLVGLANKIKLSLTMLTLPSWKNMDLTVSFFSTKYMNHSAGCPTLPAQMKLHFCSMDELPCYWRGDRPYACDDQDDIDSNHTQDFDTEEISSQVVIESIHGIDNFEKESSSSHTFDQFDPSCQKESPSPRQFHAGILSKETWTEEEQRDLSPDLTERCKGDSNHTEEISSPVLIESVHGIYSFEKESSSSHPFDQFDPSSQNESPSPHRFHAGILSKETWTEEEQRDPSPDLTERCKGDSNHTEEISSPVLIESIHGIYSFEKESSSSHPFDQNEPSCQKESPSHRVLEEDIDIVIDKSAKKDDITYARLPVRVRGDVVWPSSMEGIEIIDLFTPSPECRLVSGSKKRRVIRDSTDIIDLTRSPLFVQL